MDGNSTAGPKEEEVVCCVLVVRDGLWLVKAAALLTATAMTRRVAMNLFIVEVDLFDK